MQETKLFEYRGGRTYELDPDYPLSMITAGQVVEWASTHWALYARRTIFSGQYVGQLRFEISCLRNYRVRKILNDEYTLYEGENLDEAIAAYNSEVEVNYE